MDYSMYLTINQILLALSSVLFNVYVAFGKETIHSRDRDMKLGKEITKAFIVVLVIPAAWLFLVPFTMFWKNGTDYYWYAFKTYISANKIALPLMLASPFLTFLVKVILANRLVLKRVISAMLIFAYIAVFAFTLFLSPKVESNIPIMPIVEQIYSNKEITNSINYEFESIDYFTGIDFSNTNSVPVISPSEGNSEPGEQTELEEPPEPRTFAELVEAAGDSSYTDTERAAYADKAYDLYHEGIYREGTDYWSEVWMWFYNAYYETANNTIEMYNWGLKILLEHFEYSGWNIGMFYSNIAYDYYHDGDTENTIKNYDLAIEHYKNELNSDVSDSTKLDMAGRIATIYNRAPMLDTEKAMQIYYDAIKTMSTNSAKLTVYKKIAESQNDVAKAETFLTASGLTLTDSEKDSVKPQMIQSIRTFYEHGAFSNAVSVYTNMKGENYVASDTMNLLYIYCLIRENSAIPEAEISIIENDTATSNRTKLYCAMLRADLGYQYTGRIDSLKNIMISELDNITDESATLSFSTIDIVNIVRFLNAKSKPEYVAILQLLDSITDRHDNLNEETTAEIGLLQAQSLFNMILSDSKIEKLDRKIDNAIKALDNSISVFQKTENGDKLDTATLLKLLLMSKKYGNDFVNDNEFNSIASNLQLSEDNKFINAYAYYLQGQYSKAIVLCNELLLGDDLPDYYNHVIKLNGSLHYDFAQELDDGESRKIELTHSNNANLYFMSIYGNSYANASLELSKSYAELGDVEKSDAFKKHYLTTQDIKDYVFVSSNTLDNYLETVRQYSQEKEEIILEE
jgi:hypothetical protein